MFNRKLVFYVLIFLLFAGQASPAKAAAAVPNVYSHYGVVMDAKTGELLYTKRQDEKWYPASMTKVLTAMILMDQVKPGTMMTASKNAVSKDGSNSYFRLKAGEKMSRDDALKALLILSCNDVAAMIAEHVAGSEAKFSVLMNEKAKEIGAKKSHFVTPNGLHHSKHYTTSQDMALITREAYLNYPDVLKTMGTKSATVRTSKRTVKVTNKSAFHSMPNVIGGKTGYTNAARNALVEIVQKGDATLIGVVMKSTKAHAVKDLAAMTAYSFSMMQTIQPVFAGQAVATINVRNTPVPLVVQNAISFSAKKDSRLPVTIKNIYPRTPIASIAVGQPFGEVTVWKNGVMVGRSPLISTVEVLGPVNL
ncbi:D-alanyl-D-alanine carboxypeptidase [Bacillus sp. FJAT-42376]|uniref:D-alanyl-D-alanine carboxypeptidase family protein n=1 Tax=Bacillus sp. FJAT-42376 TaxID=2014076 RepID=UPI000F4DF238|nr:D-alanyl-D-alanine carboxypeptidase family protein [Bacillus sp. FJAT-42376]AZB41778.1 D-alanyl-D-alanine carboxypeptidase [Bacillus sp. FJAT-42376]